MNHIQINEVPDIISLIKEMQLDTYYDMPSDFRYKWIKIEKNEDYDTKEIYFCWGMEYNYNVTGTVGYIHPLINNGTYVKSFKTEANAKRNLIKRFSKQSY